MILHIVPDDKFIDMAFEMFEDAFPNNNDFIVISKHKSLKYIKKAPVRIIHPFKILINSFSTTLTKYDFVVLHWLDDYKAKILLDAPTHVKFIWIGWGGDYYSYIKKDLLFPKTKTLFNELKAEKKPNYALKIKSIIRGVLFKKYNNIEKIFLRLDFFAPVLKEDYDLLTASNSTKLPPYIDWNYGTLEDHLVKTMNVNVSGDNILLGNSATYENNHLEAFDILKKLDLTNRKIICPLSYGDSQYANHIINEGKRTFGDNFIPLTDFMPIDSYNEITRSCSVVIMNHIRQQALGNIVAMMYFGAKIFLNRINPIHSFLINKGSIIFSIDELNNEAVSKKINQSELYVNRQILDHCWNKVSQKLKTRRLSKIISKNSSSLFINK